jgi:hypothetical protein
MEILRCSAIRAERLGLRTRSAISATAGASAGNMVVVREGSAPTGTGCGRVGFSSQGTRARVRGLCTGRRRQDCAVPRGISVVKHPLTLGPPGCGGWR